jgi:integrase
MADFYTSAFLRRLTNRKGKPWVAVLKYSEPNPQYVEDTRTDMQRRKAFGKRPNTEYVEDMRSPEQRKPYIQRQITKTLDPATVKTKSQANAELERWHAQMEAEHGTPDASLAVREYAERYISNLEKLERVSASTVMDYRGTLRYLDRGKGIADVPLRSLTPAKVEAWEIGLLDGISGTTAAKAHRLLKQICEHAANLGDIASNPVRAVKPPRRTTGKPNALDAKGRARAVAALDAMAPTRKVVAAQLALYLGLRRGEICALTWGNVDLVGETWQDANERGPKIRIAQSIGRSDSGTFVKQPKTSAGARVVAVTGGLLDVLRARRATMYAEWSEALKHADIEPTKEAFAALYVVGEVNGSYYNPEILSKEWLATARDYKLVGTEGRVVTFHDLRHTYATNAITNGVDVASVAANLGHASKSVTLNMYASQDSDAQRQGNEAVANDLDAARGAAQVVEFVPKTGTDN